MRRSHRSVRRCTCTPVILKVRVYFSNRFDYGFSATFFLDTCLMPMICSIIISPGQRSAGPKRICDRWGRRLKPITSTGILISIATAPQSRSGRRGGPTTARLSNGLTSPVAYLSGIEAFTDPFKPKGYYDASWTNISQYNANDLRSARIYYYYARNERPGGNARWDQAETGNTTKPKWWFAESCGPDGNRFHGDRINAGSNPVLHGPTGLLMGMYDASNGTVSVGSIWRAGGTPPTEGDRNMLTAISGTY